MKPMSSDEVLQAIGGRWIHHGADVVLRGATIDSRSAGQGELFIAIKGEKFDGQAFLAQVASAGCLLAIVRNDAGVSPEVAAKFAGGVVGVDDTITALGLLGQYHRKACNVRVVAVTGSNGKTTVKRMIDHILRNALTGPGSRGLRGSCSIKSFNNNIGVPLTLLAANPGDDYVICEVGSNAPGEIAALANICRPDLAIITSVGNTHLEKLVNIQGVADEKACILKHLQAGGEAIVWADSPELNAALEKYPRRLIRFGQADNADFRLTNFQSLGLGQRFEMNSRLWVDLPLPGRHNALNALSAIAAAEQLGIDPQQSAIALASFDAVAGRLQRMQLGSVTVINDAYNANPSSMLAAADVLADCTGRRRVMIVGDMRELGDDSEQLHVSTGRQIGQRGLELVIGVGALGSRLAGGAAESSSALQGAQFADVQQAIAKVPGLLQAGDIVLIKGSRAMAMEQLIDPIRRAFAG
jgi:UDP-N-acetylmuramoyl-tripeptide--D-alanyl-D-alanine ligase